MDTLDKLVDLLKGLPESQLKKIHNYTQFVVSQQASSKVLNDKELEAVLKNITGILSDSGKTIEDYHSERIIERYRKL